MSLAQLSDTPGKVETLIQSGPYVADPLNVYAHVCADKQHALLLESAEIDSKDNLKSLLLVDAALKLVCRGQQVTCQALTDNGRNVLTLIADNVDDRVLTDSSDPNTLVMTFPGPVAYQSLDEDSRLKAPAVFDALRMLVKHVKPLRDHPQAVFLGGVFAYDLLASFEVLPAVEDDANTCPDYVFYLAETLLLIDHQAQQTELLGSVFSGPGVSQSYFSVSQRLEHLRSCLADLPDNCNGISATTAQPDNSAPKPKVNKSDAAYCKDVTFLKEHILAGDIFQVVPSRRFSLPCPNPLKAYDNLKRSNPSPYMFYMQDKDFSIFGASPESALKYTRDTNQVEVYPIAGTRPRGKHADGRINLDLDSRIELDLRDDSKEKAEHLMLVDLARNDVARVSIPGSRYVKDLLNVDRYSHVMHLVSRVVGQLHPHFDALHAYQACMNMGTLVGAPKISAASLIRQVEGYRRGSYGGAVGYLNGHGDMDTCIVIRSAFVKDQEAHVQAGAGVVYDSVPQSEADETRSKAQAVIQAIQGAQEARP
ncbi:anthranilate synthase component 1 [Aestuariibacter halophilus]|uniref:Anthranilate synthase component 1 n=1 Tax=Fluctibacter halophilus TaxID=226011 RepID=A0ABS8G6E0_9ALTE|nr:anthranilate synthase component 1 [Aestuariibacter halophilus]MCC2615264.1 anthranilate synthase component 1 [Aestuariibacter halophilus]